MSPSPAIRPASEAPPYGALRPLVGRAAVIAGLRAMNTETFLVLALAVVFGTYIHKA